MNLSKNSEVASIVQIPDQPNIFTWSNLVPIEVKLYFALSFCKTYLPWQLHPMSDPGVEDFYSHLELLSVFVMGWKVGVGWQDTLQVKKSW